MATLMPLLFLFLFALFVRWVIKMTAHPEKYFGRFRPFFVLVRADIRAVVRDTRIWISTRHIPDWTDEVSTWMDRPRGPQQ